MDTEVTTLKDNIDKLWHCLHALLKRVEQLESTINSNTENHYLTNNTSKRINGFVGELLSMDEIKQRNNDNSNVKVVCHETVTDDPETGLKKRTVITERVVTTKAFEVISVDDDLNQSMTTINETAVFHTDKLENCKTDLICKDGEISSALSFEMSPTTLTKIIQLNCNPFGEIDYDRIGDLIIITRVKPGSAAKDIRAGDAIVEVNGIPVTQIKQLTELKDGVTLKVRPAPLHKGPSVYYRAILDYNGSQDNRVPINFNALNLKRGDIIQAFSKDSNWIQGRKINDLNQAGLCPVSVLGEQISMLTPFSRRVLVLLGVPGVGRRTLKTMLLTHLPQYFTTVIPYTSRVPKPNELEGREYYFRTKKEMLKRIHAGDMIEWGELNGEFYGTSIETIRSCIRSGRVCVLDCEAQALRYLYNAEFMPLVVLIAPPELDDFRQINKHRLQPYTEEQMKSYIQENKKLMESNYAKMFHIVLEDKNLDATFKRLVEALNELKGQTQWVPETWLR